MITVKAVPGERGALDARLIRFGRRERRGIGDVRPLADSIRESGLRHDVTISPGYGLITGRRRLAAYEHLRQDVVPYRVVSTVPEALAVIAEEDADPRQSLPMTITEVIHRDWAMRDELEWWPRAGHNRAVPGAREEHRDLLARAAGLNASQYTHAYMVILAAEGWCRKMNHLHPLEDEAEMEAAREAAKMLETACSPGLIDAAYRQYRKMIHVPGEMPPATAGEVDAALARLTGTVAAFSGIVLPPGADADLLRHWDDILTEHVIRPLTKFRRINIRRTGNDGSQG